MVDTLLNQARGVIDVNAADEWGQTSLHKLCSINTLAAVGVVKLLIQARAQSLCNKAGKSPMEYCTNPALRECMASATVAIPEKINETNVLVQKKASKVPQIGECITGDDDDDNDKYGHLFTLYKAK